MKICIFSDIHGNHEALTKMLSYEKGNVEAFVFAGDIFGYFYEQIEIIQDLMHIPELLAVKGNHDDNYLKYKEKDSLVERYGSSYDIHLPLEQINFISSMPDFIETTVAEKNIVIFHGGPNEHVTQRIYPDTEICLDVLQNKYHYIILGHTHYRFIKKIDNTLIINPGSLGQPRDGKGFSYCILDTVDNSCQFKTIDVNIKKILLQVQKKDGNRTVFNYLVKKYRRLDEMKRIFVTAIGGDIGYGIIKALKMSNYNLHIVGCDIKKYNASYDLVNNFLVCPPYKNEKAKLAKDISASGVLIFAIGTAIIGLKMKKRG